MERRGEEKEVKVLNEKGKELSLPHLTRCHRLPKTKQNENTNRWTSFSNVTQQTSITASPLDRHSSNWYNFPFPFLSSATDRRILPSHTAKLADKQKKKISNWYHIKLFIKADRQPPVHKVKGRKGFVFAPPQRLACKRGEN